MPIFMDLHIGQDLTPEDVAIAHQADVRIQDRYGCKCLTYWIDVQKSNAYCLIDAPNKEAVFELHRNSHKQFPDEIIEVDPRVVKAFLGRTHDPEVVDYMIDQKIKVFNDPAFRVVLLVSTRDKLELTSEFGSEKASAMLKRFNAMVQTSIARYDGVAAEREGQDLIATFTSATQAVLCSIRISDFLQSVRQDLGMGVGIHAGTPVDHSHKLFGSTLRLARFFAGIISEDEILISGTVRDLLERSGKQSLAKPGSHNLRFFTKTEEQFLVKLVNVLCENWQDSEFEIEDWCQEMSMSKTKLYRRCIDTTGMSSIRLLKEFRLKKAKGLLWESDKNVAQTAFESGFNSPSYFTRCFQKRFGLKPHNYSDFKDYK
ncbi:nickel-binding protein [Salegentibacter chungangensis]|uniref:Nickel-binding protein n=1 Tax=Salegentibacter chungangensis TaxID=1335724 RepID=A0ABW3NNG5_9FLAO